MGRPKKRKVFFITKIKPKLVWVTPKKFSGKKLAGVIFLILGSMVLATTLLYLLLAPYFFSPKNSSAPGAAVKTETVKKILFSRLNWELPVVEGKLSAGQWLLPAEGVAYLPDGDVFAGQNNLVFFGNKAKILSKLNLLRKQDLVYLLGESRYLVFEVTQVSQAAASEDLFAKTNQRNLILFATNDYLKGERLVIRAVNK